MPIFSRKKQQQKLAVYGGTGIRCSSGIVPVIMMQQDVMNLILEKLEVKELLLCSLVCRVFLRTIDANHRSLFNKNLRWWSFCDTTSCDEAIVKFNPSKTQYEHVRRLNPKGMHKWLMNVVPRVGAIVHMRLNLQLAVDRVEMTGKLQQINDIVQRGYASIDALEWEILRVQHNRSEACTEKRVTIQMQVLSFVHNQKAVNLNMLESIVVNFEDVPVPNKILPLRVLFVIKCLRQCMHCHQRCSKWRSVDNVASGHRVLCSVCIEELYVTEKKLHTKWKILPLPVNTDHFSFVQDGRHDLVKYYLKEKVAMVLGHKNWAQMLQYNWRSQMRKINKNNKFAHFDFSNRWF